MICFPNAKINLGLYVTERRPDGYHNLETVFLPIPLQDVLEIKPLDFYDQEYELQVAGNKIEGRPEDNLVVRVFLDMKHEFGLPAQSIYLYKRIPTGAGLGGGSSDAAFMMRMLNERFKIGLTKAQMADRLSNYGADCPFFVYNTPSMAKGIGDILSPMKLDLSQWTLLLVKPSTFISTKEAYAGIVPCRPKHSLEDSLNLPIDQWRGRIENHFEKSVFPLHPEIEAIKQTLYDMHAVYASMSGSGSTVFALMPHTFEEAAEVFPDCFVFQKRLVVAAETFS